MVSTLFFRRCCISIPSFNFFTPFFRSFLKNFGWVVSNPTTWAAVPTVICACARETGVSSSALEPFQWAAPLAGSLASFVVHNRTVPGEILIANFFKVDRPGEKNCVKLAGVRPVRVLKKTLQPVGQHKAKSAPIGSEQRNAILKFLLAGQPTTVRAMLCCWRPG